MFGYTFASSKHAFFSLKHNLNHFIDVWIITCKIKYLNRISSPKCELLQSYKLKLPQHHKIDSWILMFCNSFTYHITHISSSIFLHIRYYFFYNNVFFFCFRTDFQPINGGRLIRLVRRGIRTSQTLFP